MDTTTISTSELIKDLDLQLCDDNTFFHLSKTPCTSILKDGKNVLTPIPTFQTYVNGFNPYGKPNGLWCCYKSDWITFIQDVLDWTPCCYLYMVKILPNNKILKINNISDFQKFDAEFPSYWFNMDYDLIYSEIYDRYSEKTIRFPRKKIFNYNKLVKKEDWSLYGVLHKNNIIFNNIKTAKNICKFYRDTQCPIERFKYKDWNIISNTYDGVQFNTEFTIPDDISEKKANEIRKMIYYIWYQTVDVKSICIWDITVIQDIYIKYLKIGTDMWKIIV